MEQQQQQQQQNHHHPQLQEPPKLTSVRSYESATELKYRGTPPPPPPQSQQQQKASSDVGVNDDDDKYLTEQELSAKRALQSAEGRIGDLMQELEDLRFFHEIDMAPSSPRSGPLTPTSPARSSTPDRQHRVLSPRRLATLDRTSLELEAQELQRRVEVLEAEKSSLEANIHVCEQQVKSQAEDAVRIGKLEESLSQVRLLIAQQVKDLDSGRRQLTEEYEDKLDTVRKKYKNARQESDELTVQLEDAKDSLQAMELDLEKFQQETRSQVKKQSVSWKAKEEDYELRLADLSVQINAFRQSLNEKETKVRELTKQLQDTEATHTLSVTEKEMEHDAQMEKHRNELEELQRNHQELQRVHQEQSERLAQKEQSMVALVNAEQSHGQQLSELQSQFDKIDSVYVAKMEDLKKSFETREQRRLDDLVETQHNKNMDYEALLADMRKQLTHATDRHQKDFEIQKEAMRAELDDKVADAKQQVETEYQEKLSRLQQELQELNDKYDKATAEAMRHQLQSETRDRDVAREWDRKDTLRQGQMDRLHDKLDRAVRDLADRDARLQSLQERLNETDGRSGSLLMELETLHVEETRIREELLSQRKTTTKFRTDLAKKESEMAEMQTSLEERIFTLETELDQARRQVDTVSRKDRTEEEHLRSRVTLLQGSLEKAQKELISEQARHESLEAEFRVELAKLEGKLSALETTLKDKRVVIETLEEKLANADEMSTSTGSKLQLTIQALQRELEVSRDELGKEQAVSSAKARELLSAKQQADLAKEAADSKIAAMAATIQAHEQTLDRLESEKQDQVGSISELQSRLEDAEGRVTVADQQRSQESENMSSELARCIEKHSAEMESLEERIRGLEAELQEKEEASGALEQDLEKAKDSLRNAVDASMARTAEGLELKNKIKDLEQKLEGFHEISSRSTSDSQQSLQRLESKLVDAENKRDELGDQLEMISRERKEAVEALEQMIKEVQIREAELEELTEVINQREEELDNAKLIATKALASAQEIKTRYKEKGVRDSDRNTEYKLMIDELNASIEFLTGKNDKLKARSNRLENELHEKNVECARLRDELKDSKENGGSSSSLGRGFEADGFFPLEPQQQGVGGRNSSGKMNDFMLMESGFRSSPQDRQSLSPTSLELPREALSTNSANLGKPTSWLEDFDNDKKSTFAGDVGVVKSENGGGVEKGSRRAVERDALRKYVRKRYLKSHNEGSAN